MVYSYHVLKTIIIMYENILEHIVIYIWFNDIYIYMFFSLRIWYGIFISRFKNYHKLSIYEFAFEVFIRSKHTLCSQYSDCCIYIHIQYICIWKLDVFNIYIYYIQKMYQWLGINMYKWYLWHPYFAYTMLVLNMCIIYIPITLCNIHHMYMKCKYVILYACHNKCIWSYV